MAVTILVIFFIIFSACNTLLCVPVSQGLGLSPAQLAELWAGLDSDGNGVLDYSEVLTELSPNYR